MIQDDLALLMILVAAGQIVILPIIFLFFHSHGRCLCLTLAFLFTTAHLPFFILSLLIIPKTSSLVCCMFCSGGVRDCNRGFGGDPLHRE